MENPYQPQLEQIIAFASREERKADLLAAKAEYFELAGEVHEDDKSFEMRMAGFLDWFVCDRPSPAGVTPAQELLHQRAATASSEDLTIFRAFANTQHSLFEVRKLGKGVVKLRELLSGKDSDVTERRQLAG